MRMKNLANMLKAAWLLAALAVGLTGCISPSVPTLPPLPPFVPPPDQSQPDQGLPSPTAPAQPAGTGTVDVYFTDPNAPNVDVYSGGPDEFVADSIDRARLSVDVAVYDFNLWSIQEALLAAHRRGVAVRLITESDNLDEPEVQELKAAGIPLLADRREGYMHNKFVVVDRLEVWTGSMNFTVTDAYRNNNNLVHISSQQLAADYTTEFEEMWNEDLFGPDDRPQTPYPVIQMGDTLLEVYFSPDDHTADRLLELIYDAQESIYFLAFSFTSDDIAEAFLQKAQDGVTVAGIFEKSQVDSNIGTEFENLLSAGLDIRLDGNSRNMHHKVIIIDGSTVVTGSYNFSANAEKRNDENTLIIHNPAVAALFMQEFQRLQAEARTP